MTHITAVVSTSDFSVQIFLCGKVCVSPALPFGGDDCGLIKGSGIFTPKSRRLWLPVCTFLVTTPHGRILFDTGWCRDMSPNGVFDRHAQILSLGSWILYKVNQGVVPKGMTIREQLTHLGIASRDLDVVAISHLDCDHANGLKGVADAHRILISRAEMEGATASHPLSNRIRFNPEWWEGVDADIYDWNDTQGPTHHSYDVFGDGSVELINIPGHTAGQVALKVTNTAGDYVLLFADGGYATKSWQEMITSGISLDKGLQKRSLEWIRKQAMDPHCVEALACHDTANTARTIMF